MKMPHPTPIAKDWVVKPLHELCDTIQDGTHFTPNYVKNGIPFYSVENVTRNDFINSKFVSTEAHEHMSKRCRPQFGDILMTRIGSLGNTRIVDWKHECSIYVSLCLIRPSGHIDSNYLYQYTKSQIFRDDVESRSLIHAAPKKINLGEIGGIQIALPSNIDEQRAIAEALSDADALIEGLERLIAKKRLIKQGAMQDLLTAKRRLPGFSGEWKNVTLPSLASIRSGGTPDTTNPTYWGGEIAWLTPTDITALNGTKYLSQTARQITPLGLSNSAAELLPIGTIVMTSRATIGECAIAIKPVSTNQGFKNFIPNEHTSGDFLYYLLVSQKNGFIELCSGSTFLEIGMKQLNKYVVYVPTSLEEQKEIAAVLSDMDAEIQALETRLDKARQVKEGMMQNLLTGRIRLV